MPKEPHGNSKKSKRPHHLYEIRDQKKNDVYKYGICGKPLNKDGSLPRANKQVSLFNTVVGWMWFFARILLTDIPGRKRAREIEDAYIDKYRKKHGPPPPGKQRPKKMTICFKIGEGYT